MNFLKKVIAYRSICSPPNPKKIDEKISVKNIQYYKVDETIFHKTVNALFQNESVSITYYSPHKHEATDRTLFGIVIILYYRVLINVLMKEGIKQ